MNPQSYLWSSDLPSIMLSVLNLNVLAYKEFLTQMGTEFY